MIYEIACGFYAARFAGVSDGFMASNEFINFDELVGRHMRTDLRFLGNRFLDY